MTQDREPIPQRVRIGNAHLRGNWSLSMTQDRLKLPKRFKSSVVVGLPDVSGECHGMATPASVKRIRNIGSGPTIVAVFSGRRCWKGPAWVDVVLGRRGRVYASFVASGAWTITDRE